jgi:hypothetical protein
MSGAKRVKPTSAKMTPSRRVTDICSSIDHLNNVHQSDAMHSDANEGGFLSVEIEAVLSILTQTMPS